MKEKSTIPAIHHITAITSSAAENVAFYTDILGLRLVKKTVNFDDPYTYHFYYGDAKGTPGTILTFFPWENMLRGNFGAGMITALAFSIDRRAVAYWVERLSTLKIPFQVSQRFEDPVIQFSDPHGLSLELVGVTNPPSIHYWDKGPVDRWNAIIGFHSATATLQSLELEKRLLTQVMNFSLHVKNGRRYRFKMASEESSGTYFDLLLDPQAPKGRPGSGTVHHIAFRTENDTTQKMWQAHLRNADINVTEVRDRQYFKSIYFHTPARILFEIATDAPGFLLDEGLDRLGSLLQLPPQYESYREEIMAQLPSLG